MWSLIWDSNCLTLRLYIWEKFWMKHWMFSIVRKKKKGRKNYSVTADLITPWIIIFSLYLLTKPCGVTFICIVSMRQFKLLVTLQGVCWEITFHFIIYIPTLVKMTTLQMPFRILPLAVSMDWWVIWRLGRGNGSNRASDNDAYS